MDQTNIIKKQNKKQPINKIQELQITKKHLFKLFSDYHIDPCLEQIFFETVKNYDVNDQLSILNSQINLFNNKASVFIQIKERLTQKNQKIKTLHKMNINIKTFQSQQSLSFICRKLNQYRLSVLKYVENLLQMCQQLSYGVQSMYNKILLRCSKFFIELQQHSLQKSLLGNQFIFQKGFDPLLLNLKFKHRQQLQGQKCVCFDIRTSDRLISAHKEMLKSVQDFQINKGKTPQEKNLFQNHKQPKIKQKQSLLKQQNRKLLITPEKFNTIDISQNISLLKNANYLQANRNNQRIQSQRKGCKLKIKAQKLTQNKQQVNSGSIIDRKKLIRNGNISFRKRLSLSMDKDKKINSFDKSTRSTEKLKQSQIFSETYSKANRYSMPTKLENSIKRLNFKAVNLQPIPNNHKLINPSDQSYQKSEIRKNLVDAYRSRNRKYKKLRNISSRTEINDNQYNHNVCYKSDTNNYGLTQKKVQFRPKEQKKLVDILFSHKNHSKFLTQDQKSQRFESDQQQKISYSQIKNPINIPKSFQTNQNFLEHSKTQNRKRHIDEVNQDDENKVKKSKIDPQKCDSKHGIKKQQSNKLLNVQQSLNKQKSSFKQQQNRQQYYQASTNQHALCLSKIIEPVSSADQTFTKNNIEIRTQKQSNIPILSLNYQQKQKALNKKIILKATKIQISELHQYFKSQNYNETEIIDQIKTQQHYICQFYLDQQLSNFIVFSFSKNYSTIIIKLIHEIKSIKQISYVQNRQKFRKIMIKKFMEVLEKSSSKYLKIIEYKVGPNENDIKWLMECGFKYSHNTLTYELTKKSQDTNLKQFVTVEGSIIKLVQLNDQSLVYSDEISEFKAGKYDINDQIYSQSETNPLAQQLSDFRIQTFNKLGSLKEINQILQNKGIDNYDIDQQSQRMIIQENINQQNKIQLKMIQFNKTINEYFIVSNGWMKTQGQLVFSEKNQRICKIQLDGQHQIYFGNGFQHILTMKNKITHCKTKTTFSRKNKSQQSQSKQRRIITKIRMFSKQLYGLIKYDKNSTKAYYGNWQMNFHYKHEFMGKILYNLDTNPNEDKIVFGSQPFFVTIYKNDQCLIGWEVEQNDFLY